MGPRYLCDTWPLCDLMQRNCVPDSGDMIKEGGRGMWIGD